MAPVTPPGIWYPMWERVREEEAPMAPRWNIRWVDQVGPAHALPVGVLDEQVGHDLHCFL